METEWKLLLRYLPRHLAGILKQLPGEDIRELRLRRGQPLSLSTASGERFVTDDGQTSAIRCPSVLVVSEKELEETFLRLCDYAVHTHQEELRQGYVTTAAGIRVGVGGTVAAADGEPITVASVTSLCLRVSRRHVGCSAKLCRAISSPDGLQSMLICGAPSSGKTSLLRDLASRLSEGNDGCRWRIAVVDERGELSYGNALGLCDVIRGCPKPEGIRRAIRLFAPDAVVFDEWGTEEETAAVADALLCGVAVVTSCHAGSLAELSRRRLFGELPETGFDWLVELEGRERPGRWKRLLRAEDWYDEMDRDPAYSRHLPVGGELGNRDLPGTSSVVGADCPAIGAVGDPVVVCHTIDSGTIEQHRGQRGILGAAFSGDTSGLSAGVFSGAVASGDGETPLPKAGGSGVADGICDSAGENRSGWSNGTLPVVCGAI